MPIALARHHRCGRCAPLRGGDGESIRRPGALHALASSSLEACGLAGSRMFEDVLPNPDPTLFGRWRLVWVLCAAGWWEMPVGNELLTSSTVWKKSSDAGC